MDINNFYFFTLDNINEYDPSDIELTDEELTKRVLNNYNLFKGNDSFEKKIMLLNNCLINFNEFKKDIPFDLFFLIYNDLITLYINLKDLKQANNYLNILYSKFNNLSNIEKNTYCEEILNLFINLIYLGDELSNFDIILDNLSYIEKIYNDSTKTDSIIILYSKTYSLYSKFLFEAKKYNDSLVMLEGAFNLISGISDDNKDKIEYLSHIIFSLGNVSFQADFNDDAEKYFIEDINLCLKNEFNSKFEISHLSFNYLSQVYVYTHRYDEAIKALLKYIEIFEDKYSGDNHLYICADFLYRIGLIYYKFKEDLITSHGYFKCSLDVLNKIENKNDDVLNLIKTIKDYFE